MNLLNAFSEAFKQRRDYLAMQVEVRVPFELRARSVFSGRRRFRAVLGCRTPWRISP